MAFLELTGRTQKLSAKQPKGALAAVLRESTLPIDENEFVCHRRLLRRRENDSDVADRRPDRSRMPARSCSTGGRSRARARIAAWFSKITRCCPG